MAQAPSVTRALHGALLDTNPFDVVMNGMFIMCYGGTAPTSPGSGRPAAEAAATGTLLRTYSLDGLGVAGMSWAAAATDNMIFRLASETITGVTDAEGTMSYFRGVLNLSDTAESTTLKRIQGTIGLADADLIVPTLTTVTATPHDLGTFAFVLNSLN